MINTINDKNAYNMDLQMAQKKEHSNGLLHKNHPKWDPTDPDQSSYISAGI